MKFILIPGVILVVCQLIKLVRVFIIDPKIPFIKVIWEGFWVGKFPSTHAAIITSSMYLLIKYSKDMSVIAFALVVSFLVIYGLFEDKKRQALLEEYFSKSSDIQLQNVVIEKRLADFSGHTFTEVVAGICIGLAGTLILDAFLFI